MSESSADAQTLAKERAGRHAASYVENGMKVGLGTGSTAYWMIQELGDRQLDIVCTATSLQSHELAESLGLRVVAPDEIGELDICIDGADEVDPHFNLTKGGGGAHCREKIIAMMAPHFVIVVDESKLVPALGPFGTPLEVLDFAPKVVAQSVRDLGATEIRIREKRTDNGNLIMDAFFGLIENPPARAEQLERIPGIVEHGIFRGSMVERVVVASPDGVRELVNEDR